MLRDLVDEGPAIPQRPWVGQGGASAPGGATHGPLPQEAWVRRDWLHVLVRKREAVLGSARLSGACSRRARLHNKALKLARSASRVRGHSACTSRPRPGMLLAQLKAKDVMKRGRLAASAEASSAGARRSAAAECTAERAASHRRVRMRGPPRSTSPSLRAASSPASNSRVAHSAGSTSSESQKRGTSLSAADSASNTRTRQGTRFPESRQGMHLAESRQGTWRTRVAACRSWLLDARAGQGSALVLEVAPLLRGA